MNNHTHPLIYRKGVNSNVAQGNVNNFFNIAKEFQLKGLNGTKDVGGEDGENHTSQNFNPTVLSIGLQRQNDAFETKTASHNNSSTFHDYSEDQTTSNRPASLPKHKLSGDLTDFTPAEAQRHNFIFQAETVSHDDSFSPQVKSEDQRTLNKAVALPTHGISRDMKELDEKIENLLRRGQHTIRNGKIMTTAYICNVCGKDGIKNHIISHIGGVHLEGISIPCNLCEKTFGSRESLRKHKFCFHRDYKKQ